MTKFANVLRPALTWAYRRPGLFPLGADLAAWFVALLAGGAVERFVLGWFGSSRLRLCRYGSDLDPVGNRTFGWLVQPPLEGLIVR